jgi:hypothetical protein
LAVLLIFAAALLAVGFAEAQAPVGKGKAPAKSAGKQADDDKDTGPPASIPPPEAKGFRLAQFIKGQIAKGVTGDKLGEAINKERAKLGLTDDDKDDDSPAGSKGKK